MPRDWQALVNTMTDVQKLAHLAMRRDPIDEDRIRRGLRELMQVTKGCRVEVIMKDNHTIGNNPQNVTRWCRIAQEEAARS